MKYLVLCTCSHAVDRHGSFGCDGNGPMDRCDCRKTEEAALQAAVEDCRMHSGWERWIAKTPPDSAA